MDYGTQLPLFTMDDDEPLAPLGIGPVAMDIAEIIQSLSPVSVSPAIADIAGINQSLDTIRRLFNPVRHSPAIADIVGTNQSLDSIRQLLNPARVNPMARGIAEINQLRYPIRTSALAKLIDNARSIERGMKSTRFNNQIAEINRALGPSRISPPVADIAKTLLRLDNSELFRFNKTLGFVNKSQSNFGKVRPPIDVVMGGAASMRHKIFADFPTTPTDSDHPTTDIPDLSIEATLIDFLKGDLPPHLYLTLARYAAMTGVSEINMMLILLVWALDKYEEFRPPYEID